MKNVLSIVLIHLLAISCSENKVLKEELIQQEVNGVVRQYFEGNPFNGIAFTLADNGELIYQATFVNGQLNGIYKEWYNNGQLKKDFNLRTITEGNETYVKFIGVERQFYKSGQVKIEFDHGKGGTKGINGYYKEYYENGQMKAEGNVKNGVDVGLQRRWDENGVLTEEWN